MIFKKNKVIFLHSPKTAGNSIQDALREYSEDQIIAKAALQDGVERFEVRNPEHKKLKKHSTIQDYYNAIGDDLFTYKIFTNIRNPYDRMVSFYFSPHRGNVRYDRDDFAHFIRMKPPIEKFISLKKSWWGKMELFPDTKFLKFEKLNEDFNRKIVEENDKKEHHEQIPKNNFMTLKERENALAELITDMELYHINNLAN